MERYTEEEFKRALSNFQNDMNQLQDISDAMEEAASEGREFDVNTIEDENVRELVIASMKFENEEITEEEMKNASFKVLEGSLEFNRFTDENWKTFVSDYDRKNIISQCINNFNENTQAKILNAVLEVGYYDTSIFSKNAINLGFINAIETGNKIVTDKLINSNIDKEVILSQYKEIIELYGEDKQGLSRVYNNVRGEIIQERPELIEQTLKALKGTPYASAPWMDASAKVQIDNKELLPEIMSMCSSDNILIAEGIWKGTDDLVKIEKFKDVIESTKGVASYLWLSSNEKVRNYNLNLLPEALNDSNKTEEVWDSIDEKTQNEFLVPIIKECNSNALRIIFDELGNEKIIARFDELLKAAPYNFAEAFWIYNTEENRKELKEYLPKLIEANDEYTIKDLWSETSNEMKKEKFDEVFKLVKDDSNKVRVIWSGLSEDLSFQKGKFENLIKQANGNVDQIISIWSGTNAWLQKDNVMKIYSLVKKLEKTNESDIERLLKNTHVESILKLYDILEDKEKKQVFPVIYEGLRTRSVENMDSIIKVYNNLEDNERKQIFPFICEGIIHKNINDIDSLLKMYDNLENIEKKRILSSVCIALKSNSKEKLNIFFEKYYPNIDIEKISDLLMTPDSYYIIDQMIDNALIRNISEDNINIESINSEINNYYQVFSTNNLPEVFKLHQFFLLHKNHLSTNVNLYTSDISIEKRDKIMLGDLVLTSLDSNNKQMRNFIEIIHTGDNLIEKMKNEKNFGELDNAIMLQYRDVLYDLINYKFSEKLDKTKDIIGDIELLRSKLELNDSEKIGNKLLNNFFEKIGLQFNENIVVDGTITGYLLAYMDSKLHEAFKRNTQTINVKELLGEGDLIKGTEIEYLDGQLRNGIRSKEFNMVGKLNSDMTPFDTDFSEIKKENTDGKRNLLEIIDSTLSERVFGTTYLVIGKNDYDKEKSYAKEDGGHSTRFIRTAIGSTNIKAIITNEWDDKYAYTMAQEGIYIPVIDSQTEQVIFTPKQYEAIREKMKGMTFYRAGNFEIDKNMENETVLETAKELRKKTENGISTEEKKAKVIETIESLLPRVVVQDMTGDVTRQNVELIDTGSTGRGTNIPGDGDFDFMLKCVDREEQIKMISILANDLHGTSKPGTNELNIRYEDVKIDGLNVPVDIDVTSEKKALATEYSSDMCVRDRLQNIKEVYGEEKLKNVVDNIIVAKKKMKEAGIYKKVGSDKSTSFGGFGGIGVENWILQNGGSFVLAMETFLDNTKDKDGRDIGFEEFKQKYPIYDFGQNHREGARNGGHDHYSDGLSKERF